MRELISILGYKCFSTTPEPMMKKALQVVGLQLGLVARRKKYLSTSIGVDIHVASSMVMLRGVGECQPSYHFYVFRFV